MTDDAAGRSAQLAVPRHMTGSAADNGTLDAALGLGPGRAGERNRGHAGRCENPFHVPYSVGERCRINAIGTKSVPRAYQRLRIETTPTKHYATREETPLRAFERFMVSLVFRKQ
jgi:hypothetical protein